MLEPTDSQQAYDFTRLGFEISERWKIPVTPRRSCVRARPILIRQPPASNAIFQHG